MEEPEDLIEYYRNEEEARKRRQWRWWKLYGKILMILIPLQLAVLILWTLVKGN